MAPPKWRRPPLLKGSDGPAELLDQRLAATINSSAQPKTQAKPAGRFGATVADAVETLSRTYVRLPRLGGTAPYRIEQLENRIDAARAAPQSHRLHAHRVADRKRALAALGGDQIANVRKHGSLTPHERSEVARMWDAISAGIELTPAQRKTLLWFGARGRGSR
jgi:hypothetical protein